MRKIRFQSRKFGQISFWSLLMCFLIVVNIPADITKGLIGHWPLDGNAKDVSGNDYHGELTKGVKWEAKGMVKSAAEFDGAGGHIKVAHGKLKPKVLDFTVVTWMKGWKAQDWAAMVSARGQGDQAYWMGFRGGTDTLTYVWNNNNAATYNWDKSIKIPKETWALVAIAIEKSKATAYAYIAATKKLELAENKIKHLEQAPLNFVFGKDDCCGERFYKGLLDEIMMFDRSLSKDEILQLATSGLTNVEAKNKLTTSWGKIKGSHTLD